MGWLRDHLFVVSLSVFLVSGLLSALVVGFLGLVVASALFSGSLTVGSLLDLWPYIPVLAVLLTTTVLSGIGVGWSAIRRLSLPSVDTRRLTERVHSVVQTAERKNSTLATLSLSDHVEPPEPSEEEKLQRLKQQYVEGTIDETEFERRIERLSDNRSTEPGRPLGGHERLHRERE